MRITAKPEETAKNLMAVPAAMDVAWRSGIQLLAGLTDSERAALEAERKRLEAKYGVESPQAKVVTARLEWLDKERAGIAAEMIRETIQVPETTADRFVVYGRTLNSTSEGVQSVTVTAVDPNGKDLARGVSDERGVFEVQVPVRPSSPGSGAGKAGQATDTAVLFQLQISSRKLRLSFKDDEMFEAVGNRLAYREITVPDARVR